MSNLVHQPVQSVGISVAVMLHIKTQCEGNGASLSSTLKLPKYQHWDFYKEWLPINVWKMMFHMEMGPFPWRPNYTHDE